MARRSMRNPRFPAAQVFHFGRIIPTVRALVAPGETLKQLRCSFRFQSLPVKYSMTGAAFEMWWFYVPMRVAWPEFPDWLINPDTSETIPALDGGTYSAASSFFERTSAAGKSALFHLAYESIVKEYFRTDEMPAYSVASDGIASAPILDMTGEMMGTEDDADFDVTVDTTGDSFTIEALDQKLAEYRYNQRRSELDGKYTTYLNRMGVRVSETALDIPEMIGHSRKFVWPSKTIDESTGRTVQSFFHDARVRLQKPRYFMEHGYVVGLVCVRPKVLMRGGEVFDTLVNDPQDFPTFDQLWPHKRIGGDAGTGIAGDDQQSSRDNFLFRGQHLMGSDNAISEFALTVDPSDFDGLRIPVSAYDDMVDTTTHDTLGGRHLVMDGFTGLRVASPLRGELVE